MPSPLTESKSSKLKLKPLNEQVIVITGASSGIGLSTARLAVKGGARVVLCSRNVAELKRICAELNEGAGLAERAIAVECDVADIDAVQRVADRAVAAFGGFDTWVNNAGASIYGKLTEVPMAEKRQLFEVNFWGVVHGCRSAIKHLRDREGGAIINIGSTLSERAIPIQGMYSASKHAVKAYTDALRMELEADGFPISVTLIKPGPIDTPYLDHAVNHMDHHPQHTPPVYAPDIVAKAILACAVHQKRDVFIGGSAKMFSMMESLMPRLTDLVMEKLMMEKGQSDAALDGAPSTSSLVKGAPAREGQERGSYNGHVFETSEFTQASLHPVSAALIATGLGVAAALGIRYLQKRRAVVIEPAWTGEGLGVKTFVDDLATDRVTH